MAHQFNKKKIGTVEVKQRKENKVNMKTNIYMRWNNTNTLKGTAVCIHIILSIEYSSHTTISVS